MVRLCIDELIFLKYQSCSSQYGSLSQSWVLAEYCPCATPLVNKLGEPFVQLSAWLYRLIDLLNSLNYSRLLWIWELILFMCMYHAQKNGTTCTIIHYAIPYCSIACKVHYFSCLLLKFCLELEVFHKSWVTNADNLPEPILSCAIIDHFCENGIWFIQFPVV